MIKQYGIDPRLVIWIQRNTGHDLQTFSDLAKIKCLDSRRRNFSAVKKIEDVRLPSWLVIKDDDFSLIGEMTKLKQLSLHDVAIDDYSFLTRCRNLNTLNLQDTNFSDCRLLTEFPALKKVFLPAYSQLRHTEVLEQLSCLKEIKEEKTKEQGEGEKPCVDIKTFAESPVSSGPLHLGDTAHLSIDGMGIVLFSAEVMKDVVPGSNFLTAEFTNPNQIGEHIRKGDITAFCTGTGGDFILWLRSGYPDSNAEKEFPVIIRLALEVRGGSLQFCDLFWLSDWNTDFPQEQILSLPDGYYHITVCTKKPESGYWGDDQIICLYFNKLEEMPELTWLGVPYLFTEEQEAEPQGTGTQGQNKRDYMEMIRQLYAVEKLQGYTDEEIANVKKYFDPLPLTLEEFWKKAARTEAIHKVQDQWIRPEDFGKWDWLRDGDYLVILIENQGCCRAGIRRKDLTKKDPPVYVAANKTDDQKWTLCTGTFSEFLLAALAYEAVFAFPFCREELVYWLTEEELETVQSGLEKQPFGLHGWLEMDLSFYSNASDNMAVIMDCGDLEVLCGAASEEGYEKLMEVMKDLGEAM